jgi:hypothetical protein
LGLMKRRLTASRSSRGNSSRNVSGAEIVNVELKERYQVRRHGKSAPDGEKQGPCPHDTPAFPRRCFSEDTRDSARTSPVRFMSVAGEVPGRGARSSEHGGRSLRAWCGKLPCFDVVVRQVFRGCSISSPGTPGKFFGDVR